MAHTPGPWTIRFATNIFGNGPLVANAGGYSSNIDSVTVDAENEANARLIAAAPDLLAAAKAVEATCPCDNDITKDFNAAWHAMLAAIAKAEAK